jgi:hypothetical protein
MAKARAFYERALEARLRASNNYSEVVSSLPSDLSTWQRSDLERYQSLPHLKSQRKAALAEFALLRDRVHGALDAACDPAVRVATADEMAAAEEAGKRLQRAVVVDMSQVGRRARKLNPEEREANGDLREMYRNLDRSGYSGPPAPLAQEVSEVSRRLMAVAERERAAEAYEARRQASAKKAAARRQAQALKDVEAVRWRTEAEMVAAYEKKFTPEYFKRQVHDAAYQAHQATSPSPAFWYKRIATPGAPSTKNDQLRLEFSEPRTVNGTEYVGFAALSSDGKRGTGIACTIVREPFAGGSRLLVVPPKESWHLLSVLILLPGETVSLTSQSRGTVLFHNARLHWETTEEALASMKTIIEQGGEAFDEGATRATLSKLEVVEGYPDISIKAFVSSHPGIARKLVAPERHLWAVDEVEKRRQDLERVRTYLERTGEMANFLHTYEILSPGRR